MNQRASTLRKAAILVSSLDRATAEKLLAQMDPQQAALVRRTVSELEDVLPREREEVIREFFHTGSGKARSSSKGVELSLGTHGQATLTQSDHLQQTVRPDADASRPVLFQCLQGADAELLVRFLQNEHPQVMAVVVAHLLPRKAADVLHQLPSDVQADVLRRLTDLDDAHPDMLREVEQTVEAWLAKHAQSHRRRAAGLATVAAILRSADSGKQRAILQNLARHDELLAGSLGLHQETQHETSRTDEDDQPTPNFDLLDTMTDEEVVDVVRAANPEVATLALAGASNELSQRVMRRMPSRDARRLRHALAHLGPTRLSDVEQAQQELARLAQRMLAARHSAKRSVGSLAHA